MFQKIPTENTSGFTPDKQIGISSDNVETIVGPSVVVEGDFASDGDILVKGTVSGSVKTGKLLTVEIGARILASIKASDAVIAGEVKGNIKVENRLELNETAKILGDISCTTLVVSPGAMLQGKVMMKGLEGMENKGEKRKFLGRNKDRFEETGNIDNISSNE